MENRKLKLIFEYKEDLLNFGQEKLYYEMVNIIKDVDKKYIIKGHGIAEELYLLFGFKDNDEVKEKLNKISVCNLEPYIKTFTKNVFKSLNDERSFISKCLKNTWDNIYKDLEIEFNLRKIEYENDGITGYYHDLELRIMSMSKNHGGGSGHSTRFDIVDSINLKEITNEVNNLDVPQSVKEMYINYFNDESEDNFNLNIVKNWVVEGIVESIERYVYENERKYKQYDSLLKQGVKEELIRFIKIDDWLSDIADAITVEHGTREATWFAVHIDHVDCKEGEYYTDENNIEIKFLGEVIKTISKSEYTVYEIN